MGALTSLKMTANFILQSDGLTYLSLNQLQMRNLRE